MSGQFGPLLRSLRRRAKLTQADLAEACGVDHTYLSKLENNAANPPSERLIRRFALTLSADVDELLAASHRTVPVPWSFVALLHEAFANADDTLDGCVIGAGDAMLIRNQLAALLGGAAG